MSSYPPNAVSAPQLVPSHWKQLAMCDTINRLEEEEQHWLQQNRRNNKCHNQGMEAPHCSSQPSSPVENYNVFGLKFWKWNISLKIPASTGSVGSHYKFHDLHEQYGPHHCPLKKEIREDDLAIKGSKKDSQWEFFGFGNAKRSNGGARQAIRNRAKSIANIYYKPIDDQQDDDETSSEDSRGNERLQNSGENIYAEIEDDVYHMWSPESSNKSRPDSNRVCMEPLPTIQHVTKIQVPPIPPKSPIRRNLLASNETNSNPPPVKLLPPYPSSVATKKSRRKSLNIDKVDGRLKRRHSVKN